jgi:hypothetical protein
MFDPIVAIWIAVVLRRTQMWQDHAGENQYAERHIADRTQFQELRRCDGMYANGVNQR